MNLIKKTEITKSLCAIFFACLLCFLQIFPFNVNAKEPICSDGISCRVSEPEKPQMKAQSKTVPSFYANTEVSGDTAPVPEKAYKYNITVTFGYLSFLYDWGTWDSTNFTYKANPSSDFPAAGTEKGKPGWYNFDGVNNKVSVESVTDKTGIKIPVQIVYDNRVEIADGQIKTPEENFKPVVTGVTMECYEVSPDGITGDWEMGVNGGTPSSLKLKKMQHSGADINVYNFDIIHEGFGKSLTVTKDFYISFRGAPLKAKTTDPSVSETSDDRFVSNLVQKIGLLTMIVGKPETIPGN